MTLSRFSALLLVLVLAWQAPAPVIAQEACGNYVVATAPQPVGHPLSDNVITLSDTEGEQVSGDFEQPRTVVPSPRSGVALVRSLGGIYGLMDVRSGAITPLSIPENEQSALTSDYFAIRNASESDFMLLASGPRQVWLVDLKSGDSINLADLGDDGPRAVDTAQISPDGKWAISFSRNEGVLISLETPGTPVVIDSEPILAFPSFDDENHVVYGVGEGGDTTIRQLDPTIGERTDQAKAPGVRIVPLRTGGPLLLLDARHLLVLDPGSSAPRVLYEWADGPSTTLSNRAGTHLLISDTVGDGTAWYHVDVPTGTNTEVIELSGMSPIITSTVRDFVAFAPSVRPGPGTPGAPYRTYDLTSGTVTTVLEQDSSDVYLSQPAGDANGRYTTVNAVSPGSGRIWLIDSQLGTATQVATSPGNTDARVSPDGCQLAVAVYNTIGEGRTSTVTVTSMVDGSTLLTVPDALLLGWAGTSERA